MESSLKPGLPGDTKIPAAKTYVSTVLDLHSADFSMQSALLKAKGNRIRVINCAAGAGWGNTAAINGDCPGLWVRPSALLRAALQLPERIG